MFNVAYGQKITIQELAQQIIALTNSKSEITHAPERAGDVKHSLAAIDKLRAAGFAPSPRDPITGQIHADAKLGGKLPGVLLQEMSVAAAQLKDFFGSFSGS